MYSMKNIDGEESNTAKGVNIGTEFNEFKDTLLSKKIMRPKMRRIQSKKHKLEYTKSAKYHYRVFMINDTFKIMAFIRRLIFTKT